MEERNEAKTCPSGSLFYMVFLQDDDSTIKMFPFTLLEDFSCNVFPAVSWKVCYIFLPAFPYLLWGNII